MSRKARFKVEGYDTVLDVIHRIALPFVLAHEVCHYLAARLLGARATLTKNTVFVEPGLPNWKRITIGLAPAGTACLLLVAVGLYYGLAADNWLERFVTVQVGFIIFLWIGYSLRDFRTVWYILKHGDFPRDQLWLRR